MSALSQARTHLRFAGRRLNRTSAAAPSGPAALDSADVAQLALLLTRALSESGTPDPSRPTSLDAYYGSEQAADRL